MKIVSSKKAKHIVVITIIIIVLLIVMFNLFVDVVDIKYVATSLNINKYEIRSNLLIDAMDNVGVCTPEEAVNVWSNGLKMRSAAMQYSVMNKELKTEYKAQLEKTFPNWVTGISSPWVDSFKITEFTKKNDSTYTFHITFTTKTSTGVAGNYNATLTIIHKQNFWRISNISADEELFAYTGFKP